VHFYPALKRGGLSIVPAEQELNFFTSGSTNFPIRWLISRNVPVASTFRTPLRFPGGDRAEAA
jgi:hypothetical protein